MRPRLVFFGVPALILASMSCGRSSLLVDFDDGSGGAGGTGVTTSTTTTTSSAGGSGGGDVFCGDGLIGGSEQCDDGNAFINDACILCQFASCGDGFPFDGVEACDDGNGSNSDECLTFCEDASCGDGFVWTGFEACDDGNDDPNDACNNSCILATCGNGIVDPGELCDDGNASSSDNCLNNCIPAFCGDGFQHAGVEQCDDGDSSNTNACVAGCILAACGDGFVFLGVEQCDDGNGTNIDGCHNNCTLPTCHDGILDLGEACDDGNVTNTDGCVGACAIASCGDGFVFAGMEPCDDGNGSNTDACLSACVPASCGDGFVFAGVEPCDDGNTMNGDGCSATCQLPICGDGVQEMGEQCDLGAGNADRPALRLGQGAIVKGVQPIDGAVGASIAYNYQSASSHTGLEAVFTSRIFFYRDTSTGVLSLFMHHGIDLDSSGQVQPMSTVDFGIAGLPPIVSVALADDTPGEFNKTSATTAQGDWSFQNNSDGGVLSSFPFPGSWSISITPTFQNGINQWVFVNGDAAGTFTALALPSVVTLTAFDTPSLCRLDCTVPACGDTILDGGEICDDGNVLGGDGCAADCNSLN